jgi:ribonucleoside-diphosphate reductase alpha chain
MPVFRNGGAVLSCADAIGMAIERRLREREQRANPGVKVEQLPLKNFAAAFAYSPECPECGNIVEFVEGCIICRACGYSQCG